MIQIAFRNLEKSSCLRYLGRFPKEIGVLFVSSVFSKKLNRTYRAKDIAPNVLTFVYGPEYAEIFLTSAVIRKDAKKAGMSYEQALVKMIIHGIIHCSGVDHEKSRKEERRFEVLEQKLIKKLMACNL